MKNTRIETLGLAWSASLIFAGSPLVAGEFAKDVAFMEKHTQIVLLENDGAAVAVAPAYQGRVMTSTVDRKEGAGFGWINRPVIEKRAPLRRGTKGEARGAYLYFLAAKSDFGWGPRAGNSRSILNRETKFEFADWRTPAVIDTEPFKLVSQNNSSATFKTRLRTDELQRKPFFKMGIERKVRILDGEAVKAVVGFEISDEIRLVAYETDNRITNQGTKAWKQETGLPSIWILGMYNPSPKTTVVIPFKKGGDDKTGGQK